MSTQPDVETVGNPPVPVRVRRSARARRLTLRLSAATGDISLTVPRWTTRRSVRRFLEDHSWWIEARRAALPPSLPLASGTRLEIGGTPVTLAPTAGRSVRHRGGTLEVPGLEADTARARAALRAWVKEQARQRALSALSRFTADLDLGYGRLSLRDPRTRWGSCTSEGNIMLSWRLMLAPAPVFDYVAAHEVAHLVEMNHSPAYWAVLRGLMPDYQDHKTWLRQNGAALHRISL